ncbi:hypothetical protein Goarm_020336 [Gossypium armourianum]|uniref:Uncharacterized protein n=1 Tax=Gossypium armourianum TaxID=34283 RepID=A0A7J9IP97_9ROSI|nr:hypothetical protein [Gossypium armourianum]
MKCCVSGQKVVIIFPHLVMSLCKSSEVPMDENDKVEEEKVTSENEDEGDKHNLSRDDDNYEAAFQPQHSTPKRPVIRSPTHLATLTGGSSHQGYDT